MQFIHAADLHIDSPLRGLERYDGAPVARLRGATRRALERLVDLAIEREVAFVLLAGDIYDLDWQDFHTGLFFREQMSRLERAAILVFMAQGNHDAQGVIGRPPGLPANVRVFAHGEAECVRIDELSVAVHGRSTPNREATEDLASGYPDAVPGFFNIGVLNTSLTSRPGHDGVAPTRVETMVDKGYDYWALGHVHRREVVCRQAPRIVYPGNLQGRHAHESGPKGCELVTVDRAWKTGSGSARMTTEFVALDVVRWSCIDVDLAGAATLDALAARFNAALAPCFDGASEPLHAVRVTLRGSTVLHEREALQPGTLAAAVQAAARDVVACDVWVEQVRLALDTPIDRSAAAERPDAVGELMRLVDGVVAEEDALLRWGAEQLGALLASQPPGLFGHGTARFDDPETLRALMLDGEATALARLAAAASTAMPVPAARRTLAAVVGDEHA